MARSIPKAIKIAKKATAKKATANPYKNGSLEWLQFYAVRFHKKNGK